MSGNKYPRGKLRADDEGQLAIKMAVQDGTLLLIFGKPVTWLGLGIADAERLIEGMQEKVRQMKGGAA
jgi:hypothetical protein